MIAAYWVKRAVEERSVGERGEHVPKVQECLSGIGRLGQVTPGTGRQDRSL